MTVRRGLGHTNVSTKLLLQHLWREADTPTAVHRHLQAPRDPSPTCVQLGKMDISIFTLPHSQIALYT